MADESGQASAGLQLVEILHIDTEGSQEFFRRLEIIPSEKAACQKQLFDLFSECCQKHDGLVASNWQGDGGHAIFQAREKSGKSIFAAREFISKLPILADQTAGTLGGRITPDNARRRFRIKAHFGQVYLTADSKFDSGFPEHFDAFLKHERDLAPIADELFITEQLRDQLGAPEKALFERHSQETTFGSLKTRIYRLTSRPVPRARNVFEANFEPKDMTDTEWRYLKSQLRVQSMITVARNSITLGLMHEISSLGKIGHEALATITIRALYNLLRAAYPHRFHLALWRPSAISGAVKLEKAMSYPANQATLGKGVALDDIRYQVVRCFKSCAPVVTQCVEEARLSGEWTDIDASHSQRTRGLQSAIQLPIYRKVNEAADYHEKVVLGVLSVDSDKPDFFLKEEADLWRNDFVGFLANLALAEHIRTVGTIV